MVFKVKFRQKISLSRKLIVNEKLHCKYRYLVKDGIRFPVLMLTKLLNSFVAGKCIPIDCAVNFK